MNKKIVKKAVAIVILAFGYLGASSVMLADPPIPACLPCPDTKSESKI